MLSLLNQISLLLLLLLGSYYDTTTTTNKNKFYGCDALAFPSPNNSNKRNNNDNNNNNNSNNNNSNEGSSSFFSLSSYRKSRALETTKSLDASRFHFQILFVDDDNVKGRIAEGLLARIAEYNDAMCVLFPSSATIDSSKNAPFDASAPKDAITVCESLGLCSTRSSMIGTSFDISYLDEYDLIIAMDDDIRSLILRSLPSTSDQEYYGPKCRLLSEFLSPDFCTISSRSSSSSGSSSSSSKNMNNKNNNNNNPNLLLDMLETDLSDRVAPFYDYVIDSSSNVVTQDVVPTTKKYNQQQKQQKPPQPRMIMNDAGTAAILNSNYDSSSNGNGGWPMVEAALILASTGITRFCLDTMDSQFTNAFQIILEQNFYNLDQLKDMNWNMADEQLTRCSPSITGYFSPKQRKKQYEQHIANLRNNELLP